MVNSILSSIISRCSLKKIARQVGRLKLRLSTFDSNSHFCVSDYVELVETWWNELPDKKEHESLVSLSGEIFNSFASGTCINKEPVHSFLWSTTLENRHNFVLRADDMVFTSWGQAFVGKDKRLITELSAWFYEDQDPYGLARLLAARPISITRALGSTLFLTASASGGNYFHWLLDVIPRFYLLKSAGINIEDFDHIIFNSTNKSFQRELIKKLELPKERILTLDEVSVVRAKCACVTSRPLYRNGIPPKWSVNYLRKLFASEISTRKNDRRIFILREEVGKRCLVDQGKIMWLLENYGFEGVRLENYTVAEQAEIFASSEIVIGVHGAGLANLVFSRAQCKVLEILPENTRLGCYWWIAGWNNLAYHYLVAENIEHGKDSPLKVNTEVFMKSVEDLIG